MTKNAITGDAARRLRKVQKRILEEPKVMNMGRWLDRNPEGCGTTGCIAGWVVEGSREKGVGYHGICAAARRLLGIGDMRAVFLFHVHNWPEKFRKQLYSSNPGTKRYARAVSDRIDYFIREGL